MAEKGTYLLALLMAGTAFAMTGGIHATETAVEQVEAGQAPAAPATRPPGVDATIPFVNHGGIRNWRADGTDALYIEDAHGNWYRATLMGTCVDLPYVEQIAFLTRGGDTLDKFSAIAVKGHRCPISALVTSAPPPRKGDAKAKTDTKG